MYQAKCIWNSSYPKYLVNALNVGLNKILIHLGQKFTGIEQAISTCREFYTLICANFIKSVVAIGPNVLVSKIAMGVVCWL